MFVCACVHVWYTHYESETRKHLCTNNSTENMTAGRWVAGSGSGLGWVLGVASCQDFISISGCIAPLNFPPLTSPNAAASSRDMRDWTATQFAFEEGNTQRQIGSSPEDVDGRFVCRAAWRLPAVGGGGGGKDVPVKVRKVRLPPPPEPMQSDRSVEEIVDDGALGWLDPGTGSPPLSPETQRYMRQEELDAENKRLEKKRGTWRPGS